jgi:arylsulfatase A-like enzyme
MPRPPSFGEPDVADKPSFIRELPFGPVEAAYAERQWRCRRESLLAVDEGVARIVAALRRAGRLRDTLIVFTSDNGYLLGEHRLPDEKINVYEESVRVPLALRGPGVPVGRVRRDLVANVDLAPTILDAAGGKAGLEMDGRSLFARGPRAILLENLSRPYERRFMPYAAMRVADILHVEYANGEREFYMLGRDPFQLRNRAADLGRVDVGLDELRRCHGRTCQTLPSGPMLARELRSQIRQRK